MLFFRLFFVFFSLNSCVFALIYFFLLVLFFIFVVKLVLCLCVMVDDVCYVMSCGCGVGCWSLGCNGLGGV